MMIEILSLSAEITVGLLIASIIWERSSWVAKAPCASEAPSSKSDSHFREAHWLFEQSLHLVNLNRELPAESPWLEKHRSKLLSICQDLEASVPSAYSDRLTGLRNQTYIDAMLDRGWESDEPIAGCLAMIDVDQLKAMNSELGMDIGDRLIRALAVKLREDCIVNGIPIRSEGGKFLIYFPSLDVARSRALVEQIRAQMSEVAIEASGDMHKRSLSASLIDINVVHSCDEATRLLTEGIFRAKSEGRNRGYYWNDSSWQPLVGEAIVSDSETLETSAESPDSANPKASTGNSPRRGSEMKMDEIGELISNMDSASAEKDAAAPNEESSTERASTDDIAALFASVKPTAATVAKGTAEPASPTEANPVEETATSSERASSEDIEALFASAKPSDIQVAKDATEAPNVSAEKSLAEAAMSSERASSDDIEALFASAKPSANSAGKVEAEAPSLPAAAPVEEAATSSERTSSDDIEALFASMKQGGSASKETNLSGETPNESQLLEQANQLTDEMKEALSTNEPPALPATDLSESASSDDIAALFAAMKP